MEHGEMDYLEALEAAISKPKYLLNRMFDQKHFPQDNGNDKDDDFTYEARKRKYSQRWYS